MAPRSEAPSRRRLTAEEARERILEAAERTLADVGPEGLRLTELAQELGVSHPAILHHFGSREGLVAAVVTHAVGRLNEQLEDALAAGPGRVEILDLVADFFSEKGNARLIAWLLLSGRINALADGQTGEARPMRSMIERVHAQRVATCEGPPPSFEDTKFRSQLTALSLLGEAIFGDLVRFASGDDSGPAASREFRRRLARLLAESR